MTRLLAIGDTHVSQNARNADRLRALDQILREAAHLKQFGAIVWPGDLFHAKSTPADRNDLAPRLQEFAELCPVIIVRGNHDAPGDLEIFGRLATKWPIHVVTKPECKLIALATGELATVACLPYPDKAGLVAAGVAAGDVVSSATDLLDPIFMVFAQQLEEARRRGELTWFMGHVNIAGSRASTGQPLIGHEIEVSVRHLDRLGPILKVVNHIHLPQEIAGAIYPGSIAPMDYGETHQPRYLVVELENSRDFEAVSVPIHVPPTVHVEGRLTRDGFAFANMDDALRVWTGADVRCRYRFLASERGVLNHAAVRGLFTGALRLKVEGVAEVDRDVRAPLVAQASTIADKLAAYRQETALPLRLAEKLAQLQQGDQAQVLAFARTKLAAVVAPEEREVAA